MEQVSLSARSASAGGLQERLWEVVVDSAVSAGLDPTKFNETHREIVGHVATFLAKEEFSANAVNNYRPSSRLSPIRGSRLAILRRRPRLKKEESSSSSEAIPPIIICGVPGTGKTTFLSLLDIALRHTLHLPDAIAPEMSKPNGQSHSIQKRWFNGRPISLLSVRKWTQLLYFYAWDTATHRLELEKGNQFIRERLRPMRVVFADEVEMTGYSPTLPDIARQGILVVGSSNQCAFSQLADELMPPRIYRFTGDDMRLGNPADALVNEGDGAWDLFERVRERPYYLYGR